MTATTTLEVRVDAQQAIRSLADIKKAINENTSVLDRFRQASDGGFSRLLEAMNRAVGGIDKLNATMQAMASGMGAGTAAAVRQAVAMEKLAQAAKAQEVAAGRAAQARSSELADLRALESAKTRAFSLESRLNRQLTDEAGFMSQRIALQDKLTASVTRYNTVIAASGANSIAGVKARGELQRDYAGISSEVARLAGLLPRLKGIEDKIPAKGWLSSMNRADRMMLTTMMPNMAQQIAAGGGQNIGQSVLTQAPELLQVWSAIPAQGKAVIGTLGAVAAAFGVVTAAMMRLASEGQNLRDISGIIRATGQQGTLAAKDLVVLSDRINQLPGVSREAAEKTVQNLARIRGLGSAGLQGAAYMGADFARAIGEQDISKATAQLGKSLSDPAKGARELNEALGFLSAGQLISIERMAAQGKRAEALQAIISKLRPHLEGLAAQGMSPLAAATDRLGNSFDHLMGIIANSSMIVGLMERMANAAQNVSNAMNGPAWKWIVGSAALSNPVTMPQAVRSLTQAPEPKLTLPMPPPLAQTAQAAGGGAGGVLAKAAGTSDAMKEVADTIAMADGYRGGTVRNSVYGRA
ncbi:MAG TPA: phage tail length tape measure family protein [Magnetospirillum sp.]|nr:phage tail length tape measure family protein [Magnetospirillum sp.]